MGVTITSTLSWSEHIHNTARKVRKLLGLLYRQFYGLVNPQQFMKLYSSIVRPHMEYASQVWNPHLNKNIDELENTQKMALRICTRQWDLSYGDLLLNSKILTLAARREYLSLCTFYKIIHNQMFFPPNILHFKKPVSIRSTSCLKLVQPFARSNAFKIILHPTFVFFVEQPPPTYCAGPNTSSVQETTFGLPALRTCIMCIGTV